EFKRFTDSADYVLIERQPLGGLAHVEQLLYKHYREKAQLIHPTIMHKDLGMKNIGYEKRKERMTELAKEWLAEMGESNNKQWASYQNERIHDIADSMGLCRHFCNKQRVATRSKKRLLHPLVRELDKFAFQPKREAKTFLKPNKTVVHQNL